MAEKLCGLVYDPVFADHITGVGHPEQPKRATHTYEVSGAGLTEKCISLPAKKCEEEHLALVHHHEYLKVAKQDTKSEDPLYPLVIHKFVKIHGIFPSEQRGLLHALDEIFSGKMIVPFLFPDLPVIMQPHPGNGILSF